jgi:hypothetical protein
MLMMRSLLIPFFRGVECPDCKLKVSDGGEPHAIRWGSITDFLSQDALVEIVGDRMKLVKTCWISTTTNGLRR